jgi:hypothetical protein
LQLLSKNSELNIYTSFELVQIEDPIKDVELYDNYTAVLLESGIIIKSSLEGLQRLHVPCNCLVLSIGLSSTGIYALSILNVLYYSSFKNLKKNRHFKMTQIRENIKKYFQGFTYQPLTTTKICEFLSLKENFTKALLV